MGKKKKKSKRDQLLDYLMNNQNTCTDDIYLLDTYFQERKLDPRKVLDKAEEKITDILLNRKRRHIRIVMFENPTAQGRPRWLGNFMHVFGAKESKERLRNNVKSVMEDISNLINTTINLHIDFHMEMPATLDPWEVVAYQCRVLEVASKPDHDNMDKHYTDMMSSTIYLDDDLICRAELCKFYNLRPRVEVTVSYLTKHESTYVYKKIKNRKSVKDLIKQGYLTLDMI